MRNPAQLLRLEKILIPQCLGGLDALDGFSSYPLCSRLHMELSSDTLSKKNLSRQLLASTTSWAPQGLTGSVFKPLELSGSAHTSFLDSSREVSLIAVVPKWLIFQEVPPKEL